MTGPQSDRAHHPSPHRAETRLVALLYGLVAAPLAWAMGELINATLAQEACFPGTEPLTAPAFGHLHALHAVVLAISVLVSASAAVIALGAWRATRDEQAGDQHALLAIGEGRSRFMALAGLLTSVGFLIAILFSAPALLLVSAC